MAVRKEDAPISHREGDNNPLPTLLDILREREIDPSATESFHEARTCEAFIENGWLGLDTSTFQRLTRAYEERGRELPDAETMIHLEAFWNMRKQGIHEGTSMELNKKYISVIGGADSALYGRDSVLSAERAWVTANVPIPQA